MAALIGAVLAILPASAEVPKERIVLPRAVVPLHYDLAIVPNAEKKTFTATVSIRLKVETATSDIVLNAADLDLKSVHLSGRKAAPEISFDKAQETASFHFAKPVSPGEYTLSIAYSGSINDSPAGLFVLDYDTKAGKKRALFTQFENSDARRFVPSWDEPGVKASFTLTATLPQAELAVSNMPIASEAKLPGGLKKVTFAPSPKMSSYLLFYGQGDFERVSRQVGDVDVGVIVKRGDKERASYALDAASEILPYYNAYFGTPYPLPKLDMIAGPGQSQFFGAMENWGAIFYFERALLIDPKISDEASRRSVFSVIAHEVAHQWFGDLVTMAWWDDLWLNEGFASWMQNKAAEALHPDWKPWMATVARKDGVLSSDARVGTHPIIQPIHDVQQASQAFDDITYSKGAAVIRMLENYLGEESFRAGVRSYMKRYAYSNTVTDDLWGELQKASGQPVAEFAHDFTLQAGVPLIRVSRTATGLSLTQSRFAVDESGAVKQNWHVPVIVAGFDGRPIWRGLVGSAPVSVAVPAGSMAVVNAGQAGYYRTLYDPEMFAALASKFGALSSYDQLGLLNDSGALSRAGLEPVADLLALLSNASTQMDPVVQQAISDHISSLVWLFKDLPGEARAKAFGGAVLSPLFAKVGWDAKPGEDRNTALLRNQLIEALGASVGDPATLAETRKRFAAFLKDKNSLSPAIRSTLLSVVAHTADAVTWEDLHHLARTAESSLEKQEYYPLLAWAEDKAVAQKALDLAMSDEPPATMKPSMIAMVAKNHPQMAFDFAVAHKAELDALIEPASRNQFYVRLFASARDTAIQPKLDAFAEANIPQSARAIVVRIKGGIAVAAKRRAEAAPKIDAWLITRCKGEGAETVCTK
ncbi:M1 family metallopeptidase [Rhizomicrobium palustre]